MQRRSRRRTVAYVVGDAIAVSLWYLIGYRGHPTPSLALWLLDFFVLGVAFIGGSMLVSQFVLPVETWPERNLAFTRMMQYLQRGHGPILFVKNGKKIAREGEEDKRGPGVILVDSASAVALQTTVAYRRSAGPGVVFTQPGEFIADTLDLRVQSRTNANVKAVTRDGIDVTAHITVRFTLLRGHDSPGQWETDEGPPYYFDEHAAFLAVFGKAVRERYNVGWTELPPLVAADVWRELLLERTLNDLFPDENVDPMPLEALQQELARRLKPPADQLPDSGSREYTLLRERGIQVLDVSVGDVTLPGEFYNRRKVKWQSDMLSRDKDLRYDAEVESLHREGLYEGWRYLRTVLTRELRHKLSARIPLGVRDVARILVDATLDIVNRPSVMNLARREHETVFEMRRWVDSLDESGNPLLIERDGDETDAE